MENPCLTFVTPTLLAGDKSLANVVAHEISHSWTGNLVTNANPEHFWLNEGQQTPMNQYAEGRVDRMRPVAGGKYDSLHLFDDSFSDIENCPSPPSKATQYSWSEKSEAGFSGVSRIGILLPWVDGTICNTPSTRAGRTIR